MAFFPSPLFAQPDSAEPMEVRLWGGKSGRTDYEVALLREVLEHTAERYPPFQLTVNHQHLGAQRGRHVVAEGERANIYVSGLREDNYTRSGKLIVVPRPTMKGLFGYRSALIRSTDTDRIASMTRQNRVRELVVGQGNHWEDAVILRYNDFSVNDTGRYENLLEMLAYGRFDTVFLGVAEAADELAASNVADKLTIAPELVVYYPHAMVFQVSSTAPELARRVSEGLDAVIADGTMDQLLEQYFGDAVATIRRRDASILVLEHPKPSLMPELSQPLIAHLP